MRVGKKQLPKGQWKLTLLFFRVPKQPGEIVQDVPMGEETEEAARLPNQKGSSPAVIETPTLDCEGATDSQTSCV